MVSAKKQIVLCVLRAFSRAGPATDQPPVQIYTALSLTLMHVRAVGT